ncbi:uncharacterized protein [Palaemon carinicauda]|uniref:uncharacterized protein n=1 Tax=Palaemon carinicauda TaxID=392227 RepID=UPI0035B59D30
MKGNLTIQEERKLKLIEDGLTYDEENSCWIAKYPWIFNRSKLPYNFSVALARLKATKKETEKAWSNTMHRISRKKNQDMLDRGVAEKLLKSELDYEGPIFYLPHNGVYKSYSSSTPVRIVFNAAASYQGISLNDLLAKGPDVMNNLLGIKL